VHHRDSVASGVEASYLAGPEAAGRWVGAVAEQLGLAGEVVAEEGLHRALSWCDPVSGEELEGPVRRARVPGFDLMFSTPKSASILFGIGDARVQSAVRHAQQDAVSEALRYLAIIGAQRKWRHAYNWSSALVAFRIHFGDRIPDSAI
jgi:conjugative relaxase-like TrwC/TraI family protein